jgi:molybdopterin molybdotransferase
VISLADARQRVLSRCRALPVQSLPLTAAQGLVLAQDVVAAEAVPPFPNSAMDGYAVRADDTAAATPSHPARLQVVGTVAAGQAPDVVVGPGQALRIMTGAPFPEGADAVAMVEVTETEGDEVLVKEPAAAGAHVRAAGEDVAAGERVFTAGTAVGPGHMGVLASIGCQRVAVHSRPRVGVISTGDELVEAGPLRPGQIRDSNRRTLLALVGRDGFEPVDLGMVGDDEAAIRGAIEGAVEDCDAVLTSGGVSMGDFDYVRRYLEQVADMAWMQVAIRPAKPLAFGGVDDVPVFGLPGNPVSSMVSYELLARPGLRRLAGHGDGELERPPIRGIAGHDFQRRPDGRVNFIRVVASFRGDGRCQVVAAGGQGSHHLLAMARANALAVVPDGVGVAAGEELDVLLLDWDRLACKS